MLTLIALTAALLQDPPAPPAPPAPPEVRTRFMVMGPDGAGRLDADGDGQVTREEFSAPMNDAFGRMDKDGDGRLSTEELASSHGGEHGATFIRGPEGPGGPGVRHFEIHREGAGHEGGTWTSSDGERTMVFVGRGEPGAGGAREIAIEGEGSPRVIQLPHGPDGPGEHRIEIRRMGGEGGHQDLDKDNDGKISEAEFTAPMREAFGRMDADRSGFIEEGERGGEGEVRVFQHRIETRRDNEN
jgi:hypothetical protein